MGTLEQQQEKYDEAVAFIDELKSLTDSPFKLSMEQNRQYTALYNQAKYGAFRHAPQNSHLGLGTREKQQWEALGNITKVEAMKRFVEKADKMRVDYKLAENAAKHQ